LPLSEEHELVIYRIAQEALTNVARHADASEVELRLQRADAGVILSVRDDGRGLPAGPAASASHGIRGMRERAMLVEAALSISRPPSGGTEVQLTIAVSPGR
jgi:two-component system sensor histidine kinase UhpB